MSSPGPNRRSNSPGTNTLRIPRRNASQMPPNNSLDPAAAQLQSEGAMSQGMVNPMKSGIGTSSPLPYRSSPMPVPGIGISGRERDASSPLRQMTNSQTPIDDFRTLNPSRLARGILMIPY